MKAHHHGLFQVAALFVSFYNFRNRSYCGETDATAGGVGSFVASPLYASRLGMGPVAMVTANLEVSGHLCPAVSLVRDPNGLPPLLTLYHHIHEPYDEQYLIIFLCWDTTQHASGSQ